jgi:hypothetical protein
MVYMMKKSENQMSEYVKMMVSGLPALVPVEHAKKVQKKQDLVAQARQLQIGMESSTSVEYSLLEEQLFKTMGKIRNLSRRIPPCVKFI